MFTRYRGYMVLSFCVVIFLFFPFAPIKAQLVGPNDAYKAVVKIYTYHEDSHYNLSVVQTGSGAVLTSDGIILTNHHVVTVEDAFEDELPVAFMICFTTDTSKKPVCNYTANLIAKDEDKDIALLRLNGISSGYYFDRLTSKTYEDGDVVQALGYPSAGGETITGPIGVISGTMEEYGLNWIKTDAVISYGASGGALINTSGSLIGITSRTNYNQGYAIDINSLNSWIGANINNTSNSSSLNSRLISLINKRRSFDTINKFTNTLPKIEFAKPSDWKFEYFDENYIKTLNENNVNGGSFSVTWEPSDTYAAPMLDIYVKGLILAGAHVDAGNATVSGKTGKKLLVPISSEAEVHQIVVPSKNYYVLLTYYYGKDNVDKSKVDQMISGLVLSDDGNNFAEQRTYEHKAPYFKLTLPSVYSLLPHNSVSMPVTGQRSAVPEIGFSVQIQKLSENMIGLTNQAYFDYIKDDESVKTDIESHFDLKGVRYFTSTDYKINNELTHEIFYKYRFKDEEENDEIKYHSAGFRIRDNNKAIVIDFGYFGENEQLFEQYLADFQNDVLSEFTLGRPAQTNQSTGPSQSTSESEQSSPESPAPATSQSSSIVLPPKPITKVGKKFIGRILLQVESSGEAWYLNPGDNKAYYLGRPADAFQVMRELGLGISESSYNSFKGYAPARLAGKILLRVEANGEAYYVNPVDKKMHYLGRPADAFQVMRNLGLGISEANFVNL